MPAASPAPSAASTKPEVSEDTPIRLRSVVSQIEQEPGMFARVVHLKGAQLKLFTGTQHNEYDANDRVIGAKVTPTAWAEFSDGVAHIAPRVWKDRGRKRADVIEVLRRHQKAGHRFVIEDDGAASS